MKFALTLFALALGALAAEWLLLPIFLTATLGPPSGSPPWIS
jgi:hypothetical protein